MMSFPMCAMRTSKHLVAIISAFAAVTSLATLSACRAEVRAADSASSGASTAAAGTAAAPATQASPAGSFTLADFAHLRYLDGSWRGKLPDGKYFYERYRIVDDSTIAMQGFSDSTYATVSDSSRIALRGTTVASEGPASRWEATRLDSTSVDFVSARNSSSGFTWKRETADRWTATIRSTGGDGQARSTVYNMERVTNAK
jgi:hypothetical protein